MMRWFSEYERYLSSWFLNRTDLSIAFDEMCKPHLIPASSPYLAGYIKRSEPMHDVGVCIGN
jgi:hypothetical protein